jgi:nicotinate-nucleotide adenylyltransferase
VDLNAHVGRVGVYGGAFDPPHRTHVALVRAAMAQFELDVMHVLPTGQAWHRPQQTSDAALRLDMARLAFAELPGVVVDPREIERPGPSYTVETLRELKIRYPRARLYLMVGSDQARALSRWHAWQDILAMAILVIAPRIDDAMPSGGDDLPAWPGARYEHLHIEPLDTSATDIRLRVAGGHGIDHLVPVAVARYIDHHHLYHTAR